MLTIHVKRLNDQAVIPTKAHRTDAGWDLYCCEQDAVSLDGEPTRVGTGISLAIPDGYYGQIQGRSGLAGKGVFVHPGVIDSGFRGEVEVVMWALVDEGDCYDFEMGDRIAQLVILPVPEAQMVDVGTKDLSEGERGANGFGSSDDRAQMSVTIESIPWDSKVTSTPLADLKKVADQAREQSIPFFPGPQDQEFWDAPEKSQNATGQTEGSSKVESHQDHPGKPGTGFWRHQGATPVESGPSRVEVQRDFWKKEASRVCGVLVGVKKELAETRQQLKNTRENLTQEYNVTTNLQIELARLRGNPPATSDMVPMNEYQAMAKACNDNYKVAVAKVQENARLKAVVIGLIDFLEELDNIEPIHRPWAWIENSVDSFYPTVRDACELIGKECPWLDPESEEAEGGDPDQARPSQILKQAQEECNYLRNANTELRQKLNEVQDRLLTAETRLSKTDVVSGRVYRALKEAYLKLEQELKESRTESQCADDDVQRLRKEVKRLSFLAFDGNGSSWKEKCLDVQQVHQDLISEHDRVKLRWKNDLDHGKKEMKESFSRLESALQSAKAARAESAAKDEIIREMASTNDRVRAMLSMVLDVVHDIGTAHMEPSKLDILNAACDTIGKPSPFFGGSRVGPKL
jgi:dUTP pyrophosphatase